jgi:hypothetical protein
MVATTTNRFQVLSPDDRGAAVAKAAAATTPMTDTNINDEYGEEWERQFYEICDKAKAEHDRDSGVYLAEIERLALLSDFDYQLERKSAAKRLNNLSVTALDRLVKARRPKKKAAKEPVQFDRDELARTAADIIKHDDILNLFARDLANAVAGEVIAGKLLYLVATSRLFDKPMSAAIKGTSAAGKSEIRKRVLDFFPPEDVVSFTSLSEKSLIYFDGEFSHKILSMGEAIETDQQNFQNYLLRELMSEGYLRHNTAQKVGNEIVATAIEKHGPVTFLVTTTKNKLHPENETRMLSIEMDDSEAQTRRVLDKVAQVVGIGDVAPVAHKPWQDFQRWLAVGEKRVVVPFAAAISDLIPKVAVRLRRDFTQVLSAIMAHALLHRDRRDRDEARRIVADVDHDYAVVRELMNTILAEGTGVAINPAVAETIEAVANATAEMSEKDGASVAGIAKLLKLDRSSAWRRLSAACSGGYVVNLEDRERMPGKYRASGHKVEPVNILPAVTDLHIRVSASRPKTAEQRNTDEIAQASQEDHYCKDDLQQSAPLHQPVHECTLLQEGHAIDNPLNSNGKSPRIARVHGFSEGLRNRLTLFRM